MNPAHFLRRTLQLLVTFTIFFVVAGCAVLPSPSFVVLITPPLPSMNGVCTGAAISPTQVVTAAHCVPAAWRVVTATGQEAWILSAHVSTEHDVALLNLDRVLWLDTFAEFGRPQLNVQAQVWGFCPWQMAMVPRLAYYNGLVTERVQDGPYLDYGEWLLPTIPGASNKLCGGDSGAPILQGNRIVGVLSAVQSDMFFIALGSRAFAVPVDYALELVDAQ